MAFTQPASMLDPEEYRTSIPPKQREADWAWNAALAIQAQSERAEPELVKIARNQLVLKATTGWELVPMDDLVRARAFVNRRPGARPGKAERDALVAMEPAEFMRSLFTEGLVFQACPDDLVWAVLLKFAEAHYGPGDMRAARQLTLATIRVLAVRAGIEPASGEELTV